MPVYAPLRGAVLPAFGYVDAAGNPQTLLWRFPARNVDPLAPVPKGADNVASDGTLWTANWFVGAYMTVETVLLLGDDLDAWLNFLTVAVNGQILTFYPNQNDLATGYKVRLMVSGRVTSSGAPAIDPRPKRVAVSRYTVQMVLRLESIADARALFDGLMGRSEAADTL